MEIQSGKLQTPRSHRPLLGGDITPLGKSRLSISTWSVFRSCVNFPSSLGSWGFRTVTLGPPRCSIWE